MPVDPFLELMLPVPMLPDDLDFPAYRAEGDAVAPDLMRAVAEPGPEVHDVTVARVTTAGGEVSALIYRPLADEILPAHIYIHGGGWAVGTAFHPAVDIGARERAVGGRTVVVSVDYRKAPEHPYPAGLDDCVAVLDWVADNAEELGIDPRRVTVGGGSAGANLAAALCLRARDEDGPHIALQLLEVPALDLTLSLPSHHDEGLGTQYALHRVDTERLIAAYLGSDGDPTDPYVSPLLAGDHSNLPPAFILSAEFDLLRDDGEAYAEKLRASGVRAVTSIQPGHVHNSPAFTKVMPSARVWRGEVQRVLREISDGTSEFLSPADTAVDSPAE